MSRILPETAVLVWFDFGLDEANPPQLCAHEAYVAPLGYMWLLWFRDGTYRELEVWNFHDPGWFPEMVEYEPGRWCRVIHPC